MSKKVKKILETIFIKWLITVFNPYIYKKILKIKFKKLLITNKIA